MSARKLRRFLRHEAAVTRAWLCFQFGRDLSACCTNESNEALVSTSASGTRSVS